MPDARVLAQSLRLELWREHLDLASGEALVDPDGRPPWMRLHGLH